MTYAKERYDILLESTTNQFSNKVAEYGISELTHFDDKMDESGASATLLNNLLCPLPISTSAEASIETANLPISAKSIKHLQLPTISDLKFRLAAVAGSKRFSPKITEDFNHVELLFLSQVSCAVQCILIDTILRDIVPLSDSIQEWNRYRGDLKNHVLYAIESLPSRCVIGIRAAMSYDFTNYQTGKMLRSLGTKISQAPAHQLIKKPLKKMQVEIETKREQLARLRELYGATLGFVCEQEAMLDNCEVDSAKVGHSLLRSVNLLGLLIENLVSSKQQVESLVSVEVLGAYDVDQIYFRLNHALDCLEGQSKLVSQQMVEYQPPSAYSRMLLPSVVGVLVFKVVGRLAWENRESILKSILDMKETATAFLKDWILEPIRDIIKTIRHKDNQISILSQASIDSELMSLERMVVDFASRKGPGVDLELERDLIRQGSLGTVLEAYERSIKAPLYSALFGDLIQTLLIQGQKTKVDASMALRALDSLLKSNELTFSLIAAIPPILLTWSGYNFLHRWWLQRLGKSQGQIYRKARLAVGRIFRILNSQIEDDLSSQERYTKQGFLLCEVHYLRQLVASIQFFSDQDDKDAFFGSIRDLESTSLSPQQRLNVIHHISTFYPIPSKLCAE